MVCLSVRPATTACRSAALVSLVSEGNALYPVLSSLMLFSNFITCEAYHNIQTQTLYLFISRSL